MKTFVAALVFAFAATVASAQSHHVVTANNASCDIGTYAAATLLLPYFDVDVKTQSTTAIDTIFTIINTSKYPQVAHVTIWTDLGYPAAGFNVFLTGYDAQTLSMFELLARGAFPVTSSAVTTGSVSADNGANPNFRAETLCGRVGGGVPQAMLQKLQGLLTTGTAEGSECPVGMSHKNAIGYVTIDVVNGCTALMPNDPAYYRDYLLFDNVLTGDYERINPNAATGNYAGGNPLIHIRAVPEGGPAGRSAVVPLPYTFYDRYTPADSRRFDRRQPLPSTFAARYIQGGPTGFMTNFAIWREGVVGPTQQKCDYAKNAALPIAVTNVVRFDEHENPTVLAVCGGQPCVAQAMPPVAQLSAGSATLLPPLSGSGDVSGWVWFGLDHGRGKGAQNPYSIARPSQNWVSIQMYAEGRYAVDFDATAMANGCTLVPTPAP
jgi:hypothetical protein